MLRVEGGGVRVTGCWWRRVGVDASRERPRNGGCHGGPTGSRWTRTCARKSGWVIGDVNGIRPLTARRRVRGRRGRRKHRGRDPHGELRGRPAVTYTDPQAAAVGAVEAEYSVTASVSEVPKTATYTHAYASPTGS